MSAPANLAYWNDAKPRTSCLCDPASCPNDKCRATNKCVDQLTLPLASGGVVVPSSDIPFFGETPSPYVLAPTASCRTIIAFTGLAGSGKSTAAKHLVTHHGFERVRFAGPLKEMLRAFYIAAGVPAKDAERRIDGDWKEIADTLLCGRTPRYAMQHLGTAWGRDLIGDSIWVSAWRTAVDALPAAVPVVVDDCRFVNEADVIREAGGVLVAVERPGAVRGTHISEGQDLGTTVARVQNAGTVADLLSKVDSAVRDLSHASAH